MTNVAFATVDDYSDVDAFNMASIADGRAGS